MKKSKITFSVLMAVFYKDDPYLFNKAIESVFNNSVLPDELILVLDGPVTTELENIIKKFDALENLPLSVYRMPENKGLSYALNFGLQYVKTDYVARADADDINQFNRFEKQLGYANLGFDLIGSSIEEVDVILDRSFGFRCPPLNHADILKFAKYRNPFNHMTVFLKTDVVKKVGGYPHLDLREDYGLWTNMIEGGARCINIDENLVLANTGRNFYKRRGGLRSVKSEMEMQKFLVLKGVKSPWLALVELFIKAIILIAPSSIRQFFYKIFLRKH